MKNISVAAVPLVSAIAGFAVSLVAFRLLALPVGMPSPLHAGIVATVAIALIVLPNLIDRVRRRMAIPPLPEAMDEMSFAAPHPSLDHWRSLAVAWGLPFQLRWQVVGSTPLGVTPLLLEALCGPGDETRSRLAIVRGMVEAGEPIEWMERQAADWRATNPASYAAFVQHHAHEAPMLVEAFVAARKRSEVTCRDLDFVAALDRRLWYGFQNVGRKAVFPEAAGLTEHVATVMAQKPRTRNEARRIFADASERALEGEVTADATTSPEEDVSEGEPTP